MRIPQTFAVLFIILSFEYPSLGSVVFSCNTSLVSTTNANISTIVATETLALLPSSNRDFLVLATLDYSTSSGVPITEDSYSLNDGMSATWTSSVTPLNANGKPQTGDGKIWDGTYQPFLLNDPSGNIYLVQDFFNQNSDANGLYLSKASYSAGVRFAISTTKPVVPPNLGATTPLFFASPGVAKDNSGGPFSGNVYVSYTQYSNTLSKVLVAKSIDGGQTFSAPMEINPIGEEGHAFGGPLITLGNGTIVVPYLHSIAGGIGELKLSISTNGASTFTLPVPVTPQFNELNFKAAFPYNSFPHITAYGNTLRVGFVYPSQSGLTSSNINHFYCDIGSAIACSKPVQVNDNAAGLKYMPQISYDPFFGEIWVGWHDARNSPSRYYQVAGTVSADGRIWRSNNLYTPLYDTGTRTNTFIGDSASDLGIIVKGPTSVTSGSILSYVLDTSAYGPSASGTGTVTMTIPSGTVFLSAIPGTQSTCAPLSGNTLSCSLNSLSRGMTDKIQVNVKVTAPAGSSINTTAHVNLNNVCDPKLVNNSSAFTTSVK